MRIALFTETFLPKVDGIVTRLCQTITFLQRFGHQVLVIAPEGGITEYNGSQVFGVSGMPLPMYPELKLALPRPAIGEAIEKFAPDLIHMVNPAVLGMAGLFYGKMWKIPLVASYHTHLPHYLKYYGFSMLEGLMWELIKLTHNQAQLNLCTSSAMIQELGDHGVERLDLWQRGVDIDQFHPDFYSPEMRSHLTQGNPEDPLLLYVGRLSPEKEIEAIKPVLERIPGARLALVGDGPHRSQLEDYFAGTSTYFAGYMRGSTLASAFASADAFMFPSRTETLGLVLLEAMAAGCPVVAAAKGGITDIVEDGVNGFLFDPSPEAGTVAMLAATQRLLHNAEDRERVRRQARVEAERWGWKAATQQLERYYQSVLTPAKVPAQV
ncbi:glycosyltransferase [Lyngbya confervoides]|uniref:Glycosyltransferase n=1 Tax=Lyngbya confervoides BDU141951 TaxID=1574623 RepID=A0ABD4T3D7_9CYAN|nr:glycosyltransferase [Lyngbya confervoides]MCM1982988.1 glycosyltransferase [Lyngbya confervoides BDU141951]